MNLLNLEPQRPSILEESLSGSIKTLMNHKVNQIKTVKLKEDLVSAGYDEGTSHVLSQLGISNPQVMANLMSHMQSSGNNMPERMQRPMVGNMSGISAQDKLRLAEDQMGLKREQMQASQDLKREQMQASQNKQQQAQDYKAKALREKEVKTAVPQVRRAMEVLSVIGTLKDSGKKLTNKDVVVDYILGDDSAWKLIKSPQSQRFANAAKRFLGYDLMKQAKDGGIGSRMMTDRLKKIWEGMKPSLKSGNINEIMNVVEGIEDELTRELSAQISDFPEIENQVEDYAGRFNEDPSYMPAIRQEWQQRAMQGQQPQTDTLQESVEVFSDQELDAMPDEQFEELKIRLQSQPVQKDAQGSYKIDPVTRKKVYIGGA